MYAGVLGVVLGLSKYHAEFIGDYDFTSSTRFAWAFAYIGLLCLAAYGLGLPEVPKTLRSRLPTSLMASGAGALGISLVQLFVGDALLPRFVVFGSALLLVPWFYAMSTVARRGRSALEQRDRVDRGRPDRPGGRADRRAGRQPGEAGLRRGPPHRGGGRRRPRAPPAAARRGASDEEATVLVLSGAAQGDERIVDQAAVLHESGVRVRTQSLFYEEWLGKIPVADLGRVSLFFDIGEIHRERFGRVKRLVDVAAGSAGLVVLAVVDPVRGPRQPRSPTGARSSTPSPGSGGAACRSRSTSSARCATTWPPPPTGPPRRIPASPASAGSCGSRHLDELPQVWNIVRGDLSLVGPRPEQPRYVAELVEKLPFYDLRHIVRPGLTGWAQVKYGYAGDERDALEKLQYDFHYLRRQSLGFDLKIVGRTTRSVFGIEGQGR